MTSSLSLGTHAGVMTTNPSPTSPVSAAPVLVSVAATTTVKNHCGSAGTAPRSSDGPSQPTRTTPLGKSNATVTTNGAFPPCPQNELTLHPPAKLTAMQKTEDTGPIAPPVPSELTQTPAAASGPSNIQDAIERNAEGKTTTVLTAATSKKQMTATALAESTGTIAIKPISSSFPTQRFKKEMCTGTTQGAVRKAKRLPNSLAKRHQSTDQMHRCHTVQTAGLW
ncbi:hypothetical protein EDB83DRAFT_2321810 [Lactarius deliciosus]|nr:hypothetical protein EDB83DRAFT_2321810 [Lactarius deliciosus]